MLTSLTMEIHFSIKTYFEYYNIDFLGAHAVVRMGQAYLKIASWRIVQIQVLIEIQVIKCNTTRSIYSEQFGIACISEFTKMIGDLFKITRRHFTIENFCSYFMWIFHECNRSIVGCLTFYYGSFYFLG